MLVTDLKYRPPTASSLLRSDAQGSLSAALVGGGTVTVPAATPSEAPHLRSAVLSPEVTALLKTYRATFAQTPILKLHPSAQQAIEKERTLSEHERIALGFGTGAMVGAGAGLVIELLRSVEPTSAAILTIGCALIGGGLGGAFAGKVIGEVLWDPKTNAFTIKGVSKTD